jgi:small subunit ribosomal protein S6
MTPCPVVRIRDREPRGGNNLRRYETIFIARADMPSEKIDGIVERYRTLISSLGGVVVTVENWGKKKLAYLINKQRHGHYILVNFVGGDRVLPEFERNLKFDEDILRAQSVRLSEKVDMSEIEREIAEARKKEEADSLEVEEAVLQSQEVSDGVAESDTESPAEPSDASPEEEKRGEE